MTWLFPHVWLWVLISALLGFAITFYAMLGPTRGARSERAPRGPRRTKTPPAAEPVGERARRRAALAQESRRTKDDAAVDETADDAADDAADDLPDDLPDDTVVADAADQKAPVASSGAPVAVAADSGGTRRRRHYDVDDVEVSNWEPGQTFTVARAERADQLEPAEQSAGAPPSRYAAVRPGDSTTRSDEPPARRSAAPDPAVALFGEGAASANPDGSAPEGYPVKASGRTMTFFPAGSPSHDEVAADVWFRDEQSAAAAGFAHWDADQR